MLGLALGITVLPFAACGPSNFDPAFVSVELAVVNLKGGDCAEKRCVQVIAPVDGTQVGEGSCVLFPHGNSENLEPLAESGPLQMEPGEDTVWEVELPDDAPTISQLNAVCEPMAEG